MNIEETILKIINETIKEIKNGKFTWFDEDYINEKGDIKKSVLLAVLQKWVNSKKDSPDYNDISDLINQMARDNELYDVFILMCANEFQNAFNMKWNILHVWQYYGYAVKKVIGQKACVLTSEEFNLSYYSRNPDVISAQTNCVNGYNWKLNELNKARTEGVSSLLPPLHSSKPRKKNEYLNYAKKRAKSRIKTDSFSKHKCKKARKIGNYGDKVIDDFKDFAVNKNTYRG